jgi:hypothetical protein
MESREIAPYLVFSIRDAAGKVIRELTKKAGKGINRVTWDLTYPSLRPVSRNLKEFTPLAAGSGSGRRGGPIPALPGRYDVSLSLVTREGTVPLAGPVEFEAIPLGISTLPAEDAGELFRFRSEVASLAGTMAAAENFTAQHLEQTALIRQTLHNTPGSPDELKRRAEHIQQQLEEVMFAFEGPEARASREEIPPYPMPMNRRLSALVYAHYASTSGITQTEKNNYEILNEEVGPVLEKLETVNREIESLNAELDSAGVPWTPGRIPGWKSDR